MSRRIRSTGREIQGDPKFDSPTMTRFMNNLMVDGKKSLAERIFYDAMEIVADRSGQPADKVFEQAISNTKPSLEVKSRRVGGATYQVPMEVHPDRRVALAIKWIISFARNRNERTMAERLAGEVLDASRNEGSTVKKKEETHRMAEANKAFAHYRW